MYLYQSLFRARRGHLSRCGAHSPEPMTGRFAVAGYFRGQPEQIDLQDIVPAIGFILACGLPEYHQNRWHRSGTGLYAQVMNRS